MQCIICYGEDIQVADVLEDVRIANDIVQVPIQIPVCRTCGERYYDRRTVHFLEAVERQLKEGKAVLREVGKVLVYS